MKNLFDSLDEFFVHRNFESRKKRKWFKKEGNVILVCEFQRFRYDLEGSGFFNFGIVFPSLA